MERGRKAVGTAAYHAAKRNLKRIKEIAELYGPEAAARQVGCSSAYASLVHTGKRGNSREPVTVEGLGLRRTDKLCRCCGEPAVIVTLTGKCVVCELLELAKRGLIQIQTGS